MKVQINTEVIAIDSAHQWVTTTTGEVFEYRDLISSLPLPVLVRLAGNAPDHVRAAASQLKWNTVYTVMLGIRREAISDHHWDLFHEDRFTFHRISYPMNFPPTLAPPGCSSIMAEISHSSYRDLSGRDLVADTISGLELAGVLRDDDEIVFAKVVPIAPAYVIYTLDHESAVHAILEWLSEQGIRTVGRFGEWQYFNMDQAIGSGRDAVRAIEGGEVVDLVAAETAECIARVTSGSRKYPERRLRGVVQRSRAARQ